MRLRVLALVLLLFAVLPVQADVTDAVEAYTRAFETPDPQARLAAFRSAERLFEQVIAGGASNADVYTGLGNAALQGEHLGKAVLAYRRALWLDPDHPRALQNLEHVRDLLPDWVPQQDPVGLTGSLFAWHWTWSRQERAGRAALCFLAGGLLVALGIRFRQSALRNAALLPLLAWAGMLASIAIGPDGAADGGVVVEGDSLLRVADSALAPAALPNPLPPGSELRILERRDPWLQVRLANGRDAWIRATSVALVAPMVEEF